ncbi:MAG: hypothetical protein QXY45_03580 [Candidatus Aenigmatarchaeota archaeon]
MKTLEFRDFYSVGNRLAKHVQKIINAHSYIAYRKYDDPIRKRLEYEILIAEQEGRLQSRFYKQRETVYKQRDFPTLSLQGLMLSIQLMGSQYGMGYVQGGGLTTFFEQRWTKPGQPRMLYDDLVAGFEKLLVGQDPDFPKFC